MEGYCNQVKIELAKNEETNEGIAIYIVIDPAMSFALL